MQKSMRNTETGYPGVRRTAIVGTLIVGTLFVQTLFVQSLLSLTAGRTAAQVNEPAPSVQVTAAEQSPPLNSAAASPPTISFSDALKRAPANNPQLQAAVTALGLAHQDLVQSRAALLPNVNYNMQFLYTEPSPHGTNNPIFIANNGVHEYIAQGNVHQSLSSRHSLTMVERQPRRRWPGPNPKSLRGVWQSRWRRPITPTCRLGTTTQHPTSPIDN